MSPVSSAGMIIRNANSSAPPAATPSRVTSGAFDEPAELRAGEVRGRSASARARTARARPGSCPGTPSNSASFSKPPSTSCTIWPARLLQVARVGAEEADQRRVGQRGEHEAGDGHDDERPDPDDRGRDDGRRLPELAELVDELGLRGAERRGARPGSAGLRLHGRGWPARGGSRGLRSAGGSERLRPARRGSGARRRRRLGSGSGSGRQAPAPAPAGTAAPPVAEGRRVPAARCRGRRRVATRGAPQFGQNRARSSSWLPHWSQNAIPAGRLVRGPAGGGTFLAQLAREVDVLLLGPLSSSTQGRSVEAGLGEERRAALAAEVALAGVGVAVDVRARAASAESLRCSEPSRSSPTTESKSSTTPPSPSGGAHVVARGQQVAGVQADAEALVAARGLDQRRQLLERAPERPAGAGGVLEVQRAGLGLGQRLGDRHRPRAPAPARPRPSAPSRGAARRSARPAPRPPGAPRSARSATSRGSPGPRRRS